MPQTGYPQCPSTVGSRGDLQISHFEAEEHFRQFIEQGMHVLLTMKVLEGHFSMQSPLYKIFVVLVMGSNLQLLQAPRELHFSQSGDEQVEHCV